MPKCPPSVSHLVELLLCGGLMLTIAPRATAQSGVPAASATARAEPWTNSLGMIFVEVPGTAVLFSSWDTRVQDFSAFVTETGYDATADVMSMTLEGGKRVGASWQNPGFD